MQDIGVPPFSQTGRGYATILLYESQKCNAFWEINAEKSYGAHAVRPLFFLLRGRRAEKFGANRQNPIDFANGMIYNINCMGMPTEKRKGCLNTYGSRIKT
jgi:hypothetical protein